jgi:hypothetical protein
MAWKNTETGLIISNHHYKHLSPEEKANWLKLTAKEEEKVDHGDILNTIAGGLLGDNENQDDD